MPVTAACHPRAGARLPRSGHRRSPGRAAGSVGATETPPDLQARLSIALANPSTGEPEHPREIFDPVGRRNGDALGSEALDLPAADGPPLGRADDPAGGDDPEPGHARGLLSGEMGEDEGDLAGRDPQVATDGPVGGDPAFGDGGYHRQDQSLEPASSA